MKNIYSLLLPLFCCFTCIGQKNVSIKVNQTGYFPSAIKIAIVANPSDMDFNMVNAGSGEVVFSGKLGQTVLWEPIKEKTACADFTSFSLPGRYYLENGTGKSPEFTIAADAWTELKQAVLKSYYFQRCSTPLDEKYAEKYIRKAGHPDTACIFHPSTGRQGKYSSPGGWYDAGDYGKYVINSGITVGTLLFLEDHFPGVYPDGSLNIPESGNGKSDLLDEVKVELDWLLTMQDQDGGVFFKLTTKKFCDFIMPEYDLAERYIIGKTTASALDFASVMAIAGRLYCHYDKSFADRCLQSAKAAWKWAMDNPETHFTNPEDISTGEYSDTDLRDEYLWAATELFVSTRRQEYRDYLLKHRDWLDVESSILSWCFLTPMSWVSLALDDQCPDSLKRVVVQSIVDQSDRILREIEDHPYRIPHINYKWGSNAVMSNRGLLLVYAFQLTQDTRYMDGAVSIADYLLGKNALNYSFVTGFGSNPVMYPHHRPSGADEMDDPIPGFLSGGPNGNHDDSIHVSYPSEIPQLSFLDQVESYASNEVAINWNAAAVHLFAAIDYYYK